MRKPSSAFARLLIQSMLYIVGLAVVMFALSSYFFSEINTAAQYSALSEGLRTAEKLLMQYQAGEVDRQALRDAVNPVLSMDRAFYMLLDEDRQVLCYTEQAAPYLAGASLDALLDKADTEQSAMVRLEENGRLFVLAGQRAEGGYVLAGRPMRVQSGAAFSFRTKLLISVALVLMALLPIGLFTTWRTIRPARMITETAKRIVDGEQVELPENLPGEELREIAGALNYMSRTVARAISDLKQEKETMALILEGLSEGILAVDTNGRLLHENAAAWRLLGGEETPATQALKETLAENREEDHWSRKFTTGDRVLYFAVSRLPAEDEKRGGGTVALIRDITEQEHLERTRHDYVANISHELRTPLASIRGLGEGLRDGLVTEEKDRSRIYNIIVNEATRLSRLVNDLLELSSLQSNPAAFEMEKVDPNELIYDLHDRNGSLFVEKELTFEQTLPKEPLPEIVSNEDRLAQVLTIFLDNARKYTPSGGRVTLGAEKAEGGVRFFVRDTGVGMDAETQRLAFERFHQAERSRSDKGSGLGLSIAREILEKMGVRIDLKSAPGQGSEFSFVIPAEI